MTLTTAIMNFIVCGTGGDTGPAARSPGMAVSAIRGQRHPVGMINRVVFGGKDAMTGVTLGANAFTGCDRHQYPGCAMAGTAGTMLRGRTAYRHPAASTLSAGVTSGTISRKANAAVILTMVDDREAAVTGRAATPPGVNRGRAFQCTVGRMARGASGMNFRIRRIHRVAGSRMTPGALGGHHHETSVIGTGMVILKGAVTGRAIATAIMTTKCPSVLANGSTKESSVNAMA